MNRDGGQQRTLTNYKYSESNDTASENKKKV